MGGTTTQDGAVYVGPGVQASDIRLTAERVHLNWSYQTGTHGPGLTASATTVYTDEGSYEISWANATLHIAELGHSPELLATPTSSADLSVSGTGEVHTDTVEDHWLTSVGYSPDTESATNEPTYGFWYKVDGPWLSQSGWDRAEVTGNFTLFIHNATLTADHADGQWTNWTGTRERAGPAPGTRETETRIGILTVIDGTLSVAAGDAIEIYAPDARTDVDGTLQASQAHGTLVEPGVSRFIFDRAPLALDGQGSVSMTALSQGAETSFTTDEGPSVALRPTGGFEVQPTQGMTVEPLDTQSGVLPPGLSWLPWALLVAGVAVTGVVLGRDRIAAWWHTRHAYRHEEDLFRKLRVGDKMFEARKFDKALGWYRKLLDKHPESPEVHNSIAAAYEEMDQYDEAADHYERLSRILENDPVYLTQAVKTAWLDGQRDRAVELALEVAERDPDPLHRYLTGPEFRDLRERKELTGVFGPEDDGGHYYA